MYVVRGRLDSEVAAALMRAVEAASDALFVEANRDGGGGRRGGEEGRSGQARLPKGGPSPGRPPIVLDRSFRGNRHGLMESRPPFRGNRHGFFIRLIWRAKGGVGPALFPTRLNR